MDQPCQLLPGASCLQSILGDASHCHECAHPGLGFGAPTANNSTAKNIQEAFVDRLQKCAGGEAGALSIHTIPCVLILFGLRQTLATEDSVF